MNEHELTKGRNPLIVDKDEMWTARDEQASEDEVGEFLFGLIRLIKPQFIIETGCYLGDATISMAKALKQNGFGTIIACDIDEKRVKIVDNWIRKEGLENIAQVILRDGKELIRNCGNIIDFAFIDSGESYVREAEIQALIPYLKTNNLFALHDTAPHHLAMNKMAAGIDLKKIYFNIPRGLTLFQK